jgi:long-chain acyl-CoA synthetase
LSALVAASLVSGADPHRHPLVLEALQQGIDEVNARQARVAQVRKFSILPSALTIEAGELTPTLKVKRKAVIERYQHLVEAMYEEDKPAMRA